MRRFVLFAGLILAAGPLAAQEQAVEAEPTPAAAVQVAPEAAAPAESRAPTLHVSRQQIDAQLKADAGERRAALPDNFVYTAAAVALGVIIAILILN
jgi:hypothetical protein